MRCASLAVILCAWVLWSEHHSHLNKESNQYWTLTQAYEVAADCQLAMQRVVNSEAEWWGKFPNVSKSEATGDSVVTVTMKTGDSFQGLYRCIPDTIDPRAPKAGK